MEANTSKFYEEEAEIYDEVRFTSLVGKFIDTMQKETVLNLCVCARNNSDAILDLGTGTARFAVELAKYGAKIVGLDPSKSMIKLSKKRAKRANVYGNISLIVADAHRLPFKKDCFSCCISINVLNHIHDYDDILAEIAIVLKRKGYFLANFPNVQSFYLPVALFVNFRKRALFNNVYSRWFTLGEIRESLRKVGLKTEKVQGFLVLTSPPFLREFSHVILYVAGKLNALFSDSILKYLSGSLFIRSQKATEG